VSPVFRFVDDHPPFEAQWTEDVTDQWDQPVWTAAVRGNARVVVTENLKHGPPRNADGVREHNGIVYLHPDFFLQSIDLYAHLILRPLVPIIESDEPWTPLHELEANTSTEDQDTNSEEVVADEVEVPAALREAINEIMRRAESQHEDQAPRTVD
jgi:hypothetical protein